MVSRRKTLWLGPLLAALLGGAALADGPAPDANQHGEAGLLELPRGDVYGAGRFVSGAWFNYFYNGGDQAFRPSPVSLGLNLPVLKSDVALSLTATDRADPLRRSNDVQLRVGLKRLILPRARYPLSLAAGLRLENLFAYPDLGLYLAGERTVRSFVLVGAAGYRFATSPLLASVAFFGVGAERRFGRKLSLSAEAVGSCATSGACGASFIGTVRWPVVGKLDIVASLAGGVGSEASLRAIIGIGIQPIAPGPEDSDGDRIPDDLDLCPDEAEDKDGYEDGDGCPDPTHAVVPRGTDTHGGPVLMRMRIPEQPIPTWIMDWAEDRPASRPADGQPGGRP